mmetsp:Transcript_37329/g.61874  ORF Transcript_37329/g.61874 Transcript_37329/m.61874 type:complete len:201 (+) Transcript_37329:306-908(+)
MAPALSSTPASPPTSPSSSSPPPPPSSLTDPTSKEGMRRCPMPRRSSIRTSTPRLRERSWPCLTTTVLSLMAANSVSVPSVLLVSLDLETPRHGQGSSRQERRERANTFWEMERTSWTGHTSRTWPMPISWPPSTSETRTRQWQEKPSSSPTTSPFRSGTWPFMCGTTWAIENLLSKSLLSSSSTLRFLWISFVFCCLPL